MSPPRGQRRGGRTQRFIASAVILCAAAAVALILSSRDRPVVEEEIPTTSLAVTPTGASNPTPVSPSTTPSPSGLQVRPAPAPIPRGTLGAAPPVTPKVLGRNRRAATPLWTKERVAALSADPPAHFFELGVEEDDRPYLKGKTAPAQPKWLLISSYPPNMAVELDGKPAGNTPLVRPIVGAATPIEVKISGPGYLSEKTVARPDTSGNLKVGVIMKPAG